MKPAAQLATLTAVLAALAMPNAAEAAKSKHPRAVTIEGEVVGQPWRAGKKTVVPVLLSARSAKRAKLHSPVGVVVLSAKKAVVPGGTRIQPTLLRPADRMKTRARVKRSQRRAPYWRIATRKLTVTKRSKTPSAAELQALLAQLRADLAALSKGVTGLAGYTKQGFASLAGDLAALRAEIAAMKVQLAGLSAEMRDMHEQLLARIAALDAGLDGLRTDLEALAGDLGEMQAAVDGLTAELDALAAGLETVSGDLTDLTNTVEQLSDTVGTLTGGGLLGGG